MNQERIPSKYKVAFSEKYGRISIMEKENGHVIETFSDNIPEELLFQRMMELREDELIRARLVEGTSLQGTVAGNLFVPPSIEERSVEDGGLII